jgi:hypothetical protein
MARRRGNASAEVIDVVDRIVERTNLEFAAVAGSASSWRMVIDRPNNRRARDWADDCHQLPKQNLNDSVRILEIVSPNSSN